MGFLDRVIGAVNAVGAPLQRATTPTDPRLTRGAALQADGRATTGRIVGIRRWYSGDSTHTSFAVEVPGSATEAPMRFGTELTTTRHLHRVRLGLDVPVRIDGGRGAIDWPALAATWGLDGSEPGQRHQRTVPDDGIVDGALDRPVATRLERGARTTATVLATERLTVLGMPTVNWDVVLRLPDGSTATSPRDEVPPYAWWYGVPGVEVAVAIDDRDPSVAAVDWAAVAVAAAPAARIDEAPPDGSLAAEVEATAPTPEQVAGVGGDPVDTRATIAANRNVEHVQGTLGEWVGEVHAGRMKPKAFLKHVAEWEAAGLCTPDEARAARTAAGLAD